MKRILTLALCLGLASAMASSAAPGKDKAEKKAGRAKAKAVQKGKVNARVNPGRGQSARISRATAPQFQARGRTAPNRTRSVTRNVRRESQALVNQSVAEAVPRVRQSRAAVTRRGPANYSWSYNEARRYYTPGVRRDRSWYSSRYNRFALFAGGYYYFDRGYWYPAYGYDSRYSTYRFDEPIYGYNSLDPAQVIVNVQVELRRQGYYRGSIDGLIGPMTRSALARYQSDRGLYVTRAIDGPTLAALGLT